MVCWVCPDEPLASLACVSEASPSPSVPLACIENSACSIFGSNCGPPAEDAVPAPDEFVEFDDEDELPPLSAESNADSGSDCVDAVLLACVLCCQSDCRL